MVDAIREPLLLAIRRALEPLAEVQAALLFGSRSQGRSRADSDVDIAVLLDIGIAPKDSRARLQRLLSALSNELASNALDLVILNDAPPSLAFQVLKYGTPALERDQVALHRYRVRTYSAHADLELVERFFRDVSRRRAEREASHG